MSGAWNSVSGAPQAPAWGTGANDYEAQQQQNQQNALGAQAASQAQGYSQGLGQQAGQQAQQYNTLGAQYGQQGQQQYGQLKGAQANSNQALSNLAGAAAGTTPNAGVIAMQQGLNQAAQQQMAMAASSRGGFGLANAQYNAANQGAALQQQGVLAGAQLAAQQQAQAQQAYAQASNAAAGTAANTTLGLQGQQLGAYQTGTNAQLGYQQAGQNAVQAGEGLQQGYENQGIQIQNAASGVNEANAQLQMQQEQSNNQGFGTVLSTVGTLGAGVASDERVKRDVADAARQEGYDAAVKDVTGNRKVLGAITGAHPPANIPSGEGAFFTRDPKTGAYVAQPYSPPPPNLPAPPTPTEASAQGYTIPGVAQPAPAPPPRTPYSPAPPSLPPAPSPSGIQPAGALALNSDERVKGDVRGDGGEPPVERFLGSLEPKTFRYTDSSLEPSPTGAGDRYLGIMAQDLEKTPEGAKLVSPGPDGVKRVNVAGLAGASAAALAHLHDRLTRLEGRQRAGVR
jgi:Chaperone of endosialidase